MFDFPMHEETGKEQFPVPDDMRSLLEVVFGFGLPRIYKELIASVFV